LVGGPNTRTDYHIESGEEFFYQLKGDMCLKIVDGGKFRDVLIKEGECFLLPARVPHSPQRVADSMGLVIERKRHNDEFDTMRWYCSQCRHIVYQQSFHCTDLGNFCFFSTFFHSLLVFEIDVHFLFGLLQASSWHLSSEVTMRQKSCVRAVIAVLSICLPVRIKFTIMPMFPHNMVLISIFAFFLFFLFFLFFFNHYLFKISIILIRF
jgi:3-hydroxyanthranilate 3,4-dioxygenase